MLSRYFELQLSDLVAVVPDLEKRITVFIEPDVLGVVVVALAVSISDFVIVVFEDTADKRIVSESYYDAVRRYLLYKCAE